MPYDAVIFDNDGILTEPTATGVRRRAVRAAFEEFDVEPTTEGVDGVVHGGLTRVRRVCAHHGVDHEAFWPRREAHAASAQRLAMEAGEKPLYDDVAVVDDLDARGVGLGVVSNNQHATVEAVLDVFDLDGRFDIARGREPTIEGFCRRKPRPHYLEAAVDALDVDREAVLYVGDSNVDVLAAARAGVDAAFVRRPHRADYGLTADPTHELDGLSALRALV